MKGEFQGIPPSNCLYLSANKTRHHYFLEMAVVHHCGAKPDEPDHRDHRKKYHEIPCTWTHPNVDLSGYVHHVYDQGSVGSCTANALCAAYGLDLVKQSRTIAGGYYYFDPSRLFLYYNTRKREGNQSEDSGASIRETVKSMNRKGVCNEYDWPYLESRCNEKPPQSCYDAAVGNNLCKYERLDHNIDQFRACLKDNCPFVFSFKVYDSFHDISEPKYTMQMPRAHERDNKPLGSHAVVAVGYNDTKQHIKVLNSWGSHWGDKGYFYMPYHFIENSFFCFDFWKISFACERGKPRPENTVSCTDCSASSGIKSQLYQPPYSGEAFDYGSGEPSEYVEYPLPNSSTSGSGYYQPPPSSSHSSGASSHVWPHPPLPSHTSGAYGFDVMNTAVGDSKLYT